MKISKWILKWATTPIEFSATAIIITAALCIYAAFLTAKFTDFGKNIWKNDQYPCGEDEDYFLSLQSAFIVPIYLQSLSDLYPNKEKVLVSISEIELMINSVPYSYTDDTKYIRIVEKIDEKHYMVKILDLDTMEYIEESKLTLPDKFYFK